MSHLTQSATVLAVTLVLLLGVWAPRDARAETLSPERERELRLTILSLLEEVLRLQKALLALQEERVAGAHVSQLVPSSYYDGTYEAIYTIADGALVPYGPTRDAQAYRDLFDLYTAVVGPRYAGDTNEFRIYRDEHARYDAFVETFGGGSWIFGINSAYISAADRQGWEEARFLFTHELAHMLVFDHPELLQEFRDAFWRDRQRSSDFVSQYARENVEEDFAETFAHFVFHPTEGYEAGAARKIEFFEEESLMRTIREGILARTAE